MDWVFSPLVNYTGWKSTNQGSFSRNRSLLSCFSLAESLQASCWILLQKELQRLLPTSKFCQLRGEQLGFGTAHAIRMIYLGLGYKIAEIMNLFIMNLSILLITNNELEVDPTKSTFPAQFHEKLLAGLWILEALTRKSLISSDIYPPKVGFLDLDLTGKTRNWRFP